MTTDTRVDWMGRADLEAEVARLRDENASLLAQLGNVTVAAGAVEGEGLTLVEVVNALRYERDNLRAVREASLVAWSELKETLRRCLRDEATMRDTLKVTQERCSELLQETRARRAVIRSAIIYLVENDFALLTHAADEDDRQLCSTGTCAKCASASLISELAESIGVDAGDALTGDMP